VAAYCAGRLWIEMLRIDTAEHFFGLRLNVFTSIVVGLAAVAALFWQRGRPRDVITRGAAAAGRPTPGPIPEPAAAPDDGPSASDAGEDAGDPAHRARPGD
jgi:hypothetical protein